MSYVGQRKTEASEFSQILDYLYVSGIDGVTLENVRGNGIKCIVNTAKELIDMVFPKVVMMSIPLTDSSNENALPLIDSLVDKIEELKDAGSHVLLFSFAGRNRSPTVALAYLMKYKNCTLKDAYEHMKSCHPLVRPSNAFFQQLIEYEMALYGANTVQMVFAADAFSNLHYLPDVYIGGPGDPVIPKKRKGVWEIERAL